MKLKSCYYFNQFQVIMIVRNDASKMVFQYNSHQETEMFCTSVIGLPSSVLIVVEY